MALSEYVKGRLLNHKFHSALGGLDEQEEEATPEERELIAALSGALGNTGWGDGDLNVIVGAAVRSLIGDVE